MIRTSTAPWINGRPASRWSVVMGLMMLAGWGWTTNGCSSGAVGAKQKKDGAMPEEKKSAVVLVLRPKRAEPIALLPEEAAPFDVILRNDSAAAESVLGLSGNDGTPRFRLLDAAGKEIGVYDPRVQRERMAGHKPEVHRPARLVALEPKGVQQVEKSIWNYVDPIAPGSIQVEAEHFLQEDGDQFLTSNRLRFDVVAAEVGSVASGYDSSGRVVAFLAWIAKPAAPGGPARLLVRMSSFETAAVVQDGATPHFDVAEDARVSLGQLAPDGKAAWLGWVGVAHGQQVELLRLNNTYPHFRSAKFALPIRDAVPVPRFPDRGHAVFLATGKDDKGPALAGMVVTPQADFKPVPWAVPLAASPEHAACAFANEGPITLLLAGRKGDQTEISMLAVDEAGKVVSPQKVVRTTPNKVLAVTVNARPNVEQSFVVLEADPVKLDHVMLLRFSLAGEYKERDAKEPELKPARNWPSVKEGEKVRLLQSAEVALEVAFDGQPWIALTDEQGSFHQSHGWSPSFELLRQADKTVRCTRPRIGALSNNVTVSCFTETGGLFHAGDHGGH